MEISPINSQFNSNYNPSFGTIATGLGKSAISPDLRMNFTHFFRSCCKKPEKIKHLKELIKMSDKPVELLYCGCSDGTAVFDDMMAFVKAGIPFDKIRINAFDIDKKMIDIAKSGRVNISNRELVEIYTEYPKNNFWVKELPLLNFPDNDIQFIEKSLNTKYQHSYQFNPELLKHINFYQGDLFSELGKRTSDTQRIISCENVAVYLTDSEQKHAADNFYRIMKPKSLLVVGERDTHCNEVLSDEVLNKEFPNITQRQKQLIWDNGLITEPNIMVKRIKELGLKQNSTISPNGCVYEKLYTPTSEIYLSQLKK